MCQQTALPLTMTITILSRCHVQSRVCTVQGPLWDKENTLSSQLSAMKMFSTFEDSPTFHQPPLFLTLTKKLKEQNIIKQSRVQQVQGLVHSSEPLKSLGGNWPLLFPPISLILRLTSDRVLISCSGFKIKCGKETEAFREDPRRR